MGHVRMYIFDCVRSWMRGHVISAVFSTRIFLYAKTKQNVFELKSFLDISEQAHQWTSEPLLFYYFNIFIFLFYLKKN